MNEIVKGKSQDWLKSIKKGADERADVIAVHGVEGSGKTSFAAQFPGAVFMMSEHETGLLTLMSKGLVPDVGYFPEFQSWQDVRDATQQLAAAKNPAKTLVVDTANGIESLLHKWVCDRFYDGKMTKKGFLNFSEGYKASVPYWREWLGDLDAVRNRGTTIVLLFHTQTREFKNPLGSDFDRFIPEINAHTWGATKKFVDLIAFLNCHVEVTDVDDANHGKGVGGSARVYYFERLAGLDAKHRHGLPSQMLGKGSADLDYTEFQRLIEAGKQKAK